MASKQLSKEILVCKEITEGTEQDLILIRLHGRRELNLVFEGISVISGKNMVPVTGDTIAIYWMQSRGGMF